MTATQSIRLATAALSCATGFAAFGASVGGAFGVLIGATGSLVAGLALLGAGLHLRRTR
jgi:hypothetical protein